MSLYDYQESKEISKYGFYGLIMAAIRQADSPNLRKLEQCWPEIVAEFKLRYNAPLGEIPEDRNSHDEAIKSLDTTTANLMLAIAALIKRVDKLEGK